MKIESYTVKQELISNNKNLNLKVSVSVVNLTTVIYQKLTKDQIVEYTISIIEIYILVFV